MSMDEVVPMAVDEGGEQYHKAKKSADNLWLVLEDGSTRSTPVCGRRGSNTFAEALVILENLEEEATISLGAVRRAPPVSRSTIARRTTSGRPTTASWSPRT